MAKYIIKWLEEVYDADLDEDFLERYGCEPFEIEADSLEEAVRKGKDIAYSKMSKSYIEGKCISGPFDVHVEEVLGTNRNVLYKNESIRECRWCGKDYDFKKRQEEVRKQDEERGLTVSSHAANYCENLCWIEADKTGSC